MTNDAPVSRPQRGLAAAVVIAMASGILMALGEIASLPLATLVAAACVFVGSMVLFAVLTYRDARSSGSAFGTALGRCLRAAGKVLVALMP